MKRTIAINGRNLKRFTRWFKKNKYRLIALIATGTITSVSVKLILDILKKQKIEKIHQERLEEIYKTTENPRITAVFKDIVPGVRKPFTKSDTPKTNKTSRDILAAIDKIHSIPVSKSLDTPISIKSLDITTEPGFFINGEQYLTMSPESLKFSSISSKSNISSKSSVPSIKTPISSSRSSSGTFKPSRYSNISFPKSSSSSSLGSLQLENEIREALDFSKIKDNVLHHDEIFGSLQGSYIKDLQKGKAKQTSIPKRKQEAKGYAQALEAQKKAKKDSESIEYKPYAFAEAFDKYAELQKKQENPTKSPGGSRRNSKKK